MSNERPITPGSATDAQSGIGLPKVNLHQGLPPAPQSTEPLPPDTSPLTRIHLRNLHVLAPHDALVIRGCQMAVFDFDGTIVQSYDFHDGRRGRFAVGLLMALEHAGLQASESVDGASNQRIRDGLRWARDYVRANWHTEFAHFAGSAESVVIQRGFDHVIERLRGDGHDHLSAFFTLERVEAFGADFLRRVLEKPAVARKLCPLVPGVVDLLERGREASVEQRLCSASGERFVTGMVTAHGLHGHLPGGIYSATKLLPDGTFSGEPVRAARALTQLGTERTVMYGDSKGDVGSAVMDGVPLVVIHVRDIDNPRVIESYAQTLALLTSNLENPPHVVLVPEWSRVTYDAPLGNRTGIHFEIVGAAQDMDGSPGGSDRSLFI